MTELDLIKAVGMSVLFFAIFVVLPLIYLLTDHQRKMLRLMRGEQIEESDETLKLLLGAPSSKPSIASSDVQVLGQRLQCLESEVALLKARQAEQETQLRQRLG